MKSALVASLSFVLNKLTPEEKGSADPSDPINGNRLVLNIVKDLEEANKAFMAATKATSDVLDAKAREYQTKLDEIAPLDGNEANFKKRQEEAQRMSAEYKKFADEVNAKSEAKPDEIISISLSDEKYAVLPDLLKKTVKMWDKSDSVYLVECADAIDAAV